MNFSSDNIELFLAVLDRGSFSAAARALRRRPPSAWVSPTWRRTRFRIVRSLAPRTDADRAGVGLAPHARLIAGQLKQLQVHAIELSQGWKARFRSAWRLTSTAPACWWR